MDKLKVLPQVCHCWPIGMSDEYSHLQLVPCLIRHFYDIDENLASTHHVHLIWTVGGAAEEYPEPR